MCCALNSLVICREKRAKETDEQDSDADSVTSEDFNAFMDTIGGKEDGGAADVDLNFAAASAEDLQGLDSGSDDADDSDVAEGADFGGDDDSEEEPELEGEDDGSDSIEFENIGDLGSENNDDDDDEFDEENFVNSDNDDESDEQPLPTPSKRKKKAESLLGPKKKKKKSAGGDFRSLLASAEEFADLMDQNDGGREFDGSIEAVSTVKDKAGSKQLKWERDRADRKKWIKGNRSGGGGRRHKKR